MVLRKLSLVALPLLLVTASALPGRAQDDRSGRYAFADTTLLRDTLGLHFRGLFRLADSLETTPDTLRAVSIRYRLTLPRLVALADSLHIPFDSVGVTLERERFNPLAARTTTTSDFKYNTTYTLQQNRSSWINLSDYNLVHGPLFVRNVTTIQQDRIDNTRATSLWQTRDATTEVGWLLTKNNSLGARAVLNRFNSDDPSTITKVGETRNEYQLSLRTKQRPARTIDSELNLFAGALDLHNTDKRQRGWSAEGNGRYHQSSGRWFVHDVTGEMSANQSRIDLIATSERDDSRDLVGNLRGNVSLFNQSRLGLKTNYTLQGSDVGQPGTTGGITRVKSSRAGMDAALRARVGTDGYVSVTERLAHSREVTALNGPSTRSTNGLALESNTTYGGFGVESRFTTDFTATESPQLSAAGGYGGRSNVRALEGTVSRSLGRFNARVNSRISLNSYRFEAIGSYGTPPISRDEARQSYRMEGSYAFSQDFTSGITLEVDRNQLVNIPSASTGTNNTLRSYQAEWRWTYRLFAGLTATQRNTLGANYTSFNFIRRADRLFLDYGTTTTLNAVLTPRLSMDLTHISKVQPSGGWTRDPDGQWFFQPSDESRTFTLTSRIQYSPSPVISLTLSPAYRSNDRDGTLNGISTPTSRNRNLNFMGSANLNVPVGRGLLSGSIGRTYTADRSIGFSSGVQRPSPRSEQDYWSGSLQFSWQP
jgi:hypothetical protein